MDRQTLALCFFITAWLALGEKERLNLGLTMFSFYGEEALGSLSVASKAIMLIFMLFIPLPGNSSQRSHVGLRKNEVLLSIY